MEVNRKKRSHEELCTVFPNIGNLFPPFKEKDSMFFSRNFVVVNHKKMKSQNHRGLEKCKKMLRLASMV